MTARLHRNLKLSQPRICQFPWEFESLKPVDYELAEDDKSMGSECVYTPKAAESAK